jgi:hypothetical protein
LFVLRQQQFHALAQTGVARADFVQERGTLRGAFAIQGGGEDFSLGHGATLFSSHSSQHPSQPDA